MKKLALLACAAFLVACGQKETEPTETSTQVEQTSQTTEDTSSEQAIKPSSPLDYPRVDANYAASPDLLEDIKPYVGYYSTEFVLPLWKLIGGADHDTILEFTVDLAIYEDGTSTSYVHYTGDIEHAPETQGQVYATKDNQLKTAINAATLGSGEAKMTYGQLELSNDVGLYQDYLDETGNLLPLFTIKHYKTLSPEIRFIGKEGNIELILNTPGGDLSTTVEPTGQAPKSLKYTPNQLLAYYDDNEEALKSKISIKSTNDFINLLQISTEGSIFNPYYYLSSQKSLDEKFSLASPEQTSGYYTSDNKEIKNIQYALNNYNSEIYSIIDDKLWRLYMSNGIKAAEERELIRMYIINLDHYPKEDN